MSVNYSAGLSPYMHKGKCGMPEKYDTDEELNNSISLLAKWIRDSKYTVVHTGAGISTSAGIPDFRGPKGVWTLEEKGQAPNCNINFEDAIPTYSHLALVELEKRGLVNYIISQNVDGMHLRSGFPLDKLSELHGNMFVQKCHHCLKEHVKHFSSPTMALKFTGEKCNTDKSNGRKCRGKLKDTILDWEDSLPDKHLEAAEDACKKSELSITLGTSLQILPAANLPLLTKKNGGKLVIVNLQPTKHDKKADLRIHGYIDDVIKGVMQCLGIVVPPFNGIVVKYSSTHHNMDQVKSDNDKVDESKFNNGDCDDNKQGLKRKLSNDIIDENKEIKYLVKNEKDT